ncbi:MAG: hypothetical protein K0S47_4158 [Herbinix sp.]|jgi:hypothetical protein|nr:hypothetical protein [Herbinix sp.]
MNIKKYAEANNSSHKKDNSKYGGKSAFERPLKVLSKKNKQRMAKYSR